MTLNRLPQVPPVDTGPQQVDVGERVMGQEAGEVPFGLAGGIQLAGERGVGEGGARAGEFAASAVVQADVDGQISTAP
jgi:hypothetical protein